MLENETDINEAVEVIQEDEYDEEKLILYKPKKGFYIKQRHFELDDIRLLAECINSAKFISKGQAERLLKVICDFVSRHQAKQIKGDAFVIDRPKTENTFLIHIVATINNAMSYSLDGEEHEPEKISFNYMKYSINDLNKQVAQRKGEKYVVSPFKLIVNEGNYYLLGYDDKYKRLQTYRVDKMKDVEFTSEPREGEEEYKNTDIDSLIKRRFSMFSGKTELVSMAFQHQLLDAVVERFGKKGVSYSKLDHDFFKVITKVDVSDPFFGWLTSFGRRAKILEPENVVEDYKAYLDKVRGMY